MRAIGEINMIILQITVLKCLRCYFICLIRNQELYNMYVKTFPKFQRFLVGIVFNA